MGQESLNGCQFVEEALTDESKTRTPPAFGVERGDNPVPAHNSVAGLVRAVSLEGAKLDTVRGWDEGEGYVRLAPEDPAVYSKQKCLKVMRWRC